MVPCYTSYTDTRPTRHSSQRPHFPKITFLHKQTMKTVRNPPWKLHLRHHVQLRRLRVHHQERRLSLPLVVHVCHQVPIVLLTPFLLRHEERFPAVAPLAEHPASHRTVPPLIRLRHVQLHHPRDLRHRVSHRRVNEPVLLPNECRVYNREIKVPRRHRLPRHHPRLQIDLHLLHHRVNQLHSFQCVLHRQNIWRQQYHRSSPVLLPRIYRVNYIKTRHVEPLHLGFILSITRKDSNPWDLGSDGADGGATGDHVERIHSELNVAEDCIVLGDGEIVEKRR
ncbi:hypothetical protein V8G54_015997 [Vigna mungo]|uniref:Uncharacterized protein n=1 Tax=Vigna mungo TaxID=3915 RepID=A0AAQ3NN77_VIGMU